MATHYERLRTLIATYSDIDRAKEILEWDQQTYMPPGGAAERAEQISTLARLAHEHLTADEMGEAIEAALHETGNADKDSDEYCVTRHMSRYFEKRKRIPVEWVAEYSRITSLAQSSWEKAKPAEDFASFRPHLEKVIEYRRAYSEFFAPYDHVYDPQLDYFEPGMKTAEVRAVFAELRPAQVALVQAIADRGRPVDDSPLHQTFDIDKQWGFGVDIAKQFGYDFNRGRQDKSAHPFTTFFGLGDVRITTRFLPNYVGSALFSTMHEAGHAMYGQGVDPRLGRSENIGGASYAFHESQSRMWENLVGRSRPFWKAFYPKLQQTFPAQLGSVDMEAFYRAINKVERSLVRVEADEATYNLHIMLRFELEIDLLEKKLEARDLPAAWKQKAQDYLGLTPKNDREGVLQDIHWSAGYVGYFPTYSLGNLISVQLWEKIRTDIPDLEKQIERAQFAPLLGWLRDKVHRHGAKYEPVDLLRRVTGQGLQAKPYLNYLTTKYGEIYNL
jgi:carboxypeptidase Taq